MRTWVRQSGGLVIGRCAGIGVVRSMAHSPALTRHSLNEVGNAERAAPSFAIKPRLLLDILYGGRGYINQPNCWNKSHHFVTGYSTAATKLALLSTVTFCTPAQTNAVNSLWIKRTNALNSIFTGISTLHVSGSLSAHHQEFLAYMGFGTFYTAVTVCFQEWDPSYFW